jgi:hypothetical protein
MLRLSIKLLRAVAGTWYYRDNIDAVRGRSASLRCRAELIPEVDNPHDPNSVRVEIMGRTVGHLARNDAEQFRSRFGTASTSCGAEIDVSWRGRNRQWGVHLDIEL